MAAPTAHPTRDAPRAWCCLTPGAVPAPTPITGLTPGSTAARRLARCSALGVLALAISTHSARAQGAGLAGRTVPASARAATDTATGTNTDTLPPALARRAPSLFTRRYAALGVGFVAATVALFPLDRSIAEHLQRPNLQRHAALDHAATGFELLAVPGVFVASGGAYVVGRLGHHAPLADAGLHVGEATVLAAVVTQVVKDAAGRARPYMSGDANPHDFQFGRGLTKGEDYSAFPSGHATLAFAAASALTSETSHWWPHATRVVAPLAYSGATLVGLSRMVHDKHWASDVALGAGVGTLSGFTVVRYQHTHPRNRIDRWFLSAAVAPAPGGAVVAWSIPTR